MIDKLHQPNLSMTIFLGGRNLYIKGWCSTNGLFEIQEKNQSYKYIQDPSCTALKIGTSYHDYVPRGDLGRIRLGLYGIMSYFDVLEKCRGQVSNGTLAAITGFAVNICEATRLAEVKQAVLDSYDNYHLVYLGTSGENLSRKIRKYGRSSRQCMKCVEALINGKPMPEIDGLSGLGLNCLEDLIKKVSVLLRSPELLALFNDEYEPESDVWSPPCPESVKEDYNLADKYKNLEFEEDGKTEDENG